MQAGEHPPLLDVIRYLVARRSFLHMAFAAGLCSFVGYAVVIFFPSFIVRTYQMQIVSIGIWLGLILGIAGGIGFFSGGALFDFFGRRDKRRGLWFIATTQLMSAAVYFGVYLAPSAYWSLILFIIPVVISNFYLAPVLAQAQSLAPLRMRSVSSAITLFIINVIGLGLGSWAVGALSDALAPRFGDDSLRYALMAATIVILPWAAGHYYLASRSIETDLRTRM